MCNYILIISGYSPQPTFHTLFMYTLDDVSTHLSSHHLRKNFSESVTVCVWKGSYVDYVNATTFQRSWGTPCAIAKPLRESYLAVQDLPTLMSRRECWKTTYETLVQNFERMNHRPRIANTKENDEERNDLLNSRIIQYSAGIRTHWQWQYVVNLLCDFMMDY